MLLTSRQTRLLKRNLKRCEISIKERTLELNEKLAKQELDIQTKESQIEQKIKASNKLEKSLRKKRKILTQRKMNYSKSKNL